MARDATVILNELRCFAEEDASGGSEPYIWPALIWVDDITLGTPEHVGIVAPAVANSRVQIASNMRGGQSVDIPAQVGFLRVRLEDDLRLQQLILVATLMEEDETPDKAVDAAYRAYVEALQREVGERILLLALASEQDRDVLIDQITAEVSRAASRAAEGALTASQKVRIFIGTLNLDDTVDTSVTTIATIEDRELTLTFRHRSGGSLDQIYRIEGMLRVRPVPVETCSEEVAAVQAAQKAVGAVDASIRAAQDELGTAMPALKPFLVAEIRRLKRDELPAAQARLEAAQAALAACRRRGLTALEREAVGPPVVAPAER
jgi:hypothetical protein